jgi:hypothetical protein
VIAGCSKAATSSMYLRIGIPSPKAPPWEAGHSHAAGTVLSARCPTDHSVIARLTVAPVRHLRERRDGVSAAPVRRPLMRFEPVSLTCWC